MKILRQLLLRERNIILVYIVGILRHVVWITVLSTRFQAQKLERYLFSPKSAVQQNCILICSRKKSQYIIREVSLLD